MFTFIPSLGYTIKLMLISMIILTHFNTCTLIQAYIPAHIRIHTHWQPYSHSQSFMYLLFALKIHNHSNIQIVTQMHNQTHTYTSMIILTHFNTCTLIQVAAFVTLTMRCKMEIAQERPGRPIAAATQHLMPDLATSPPIFAVSNPATEAEDDPGWSTSETSDSQFTI